MQVVEKVLNEDSQGRFFVLIIHPTLSVSANQTFKGIRFALAPFS